MNNLLLGHEGAVAIVTLNRPNARNALSLELQREIAETFDQLAVNHDVAVIILTGAGERAFSAGLDLKELASGINLIDGGVDPVAAVANCSKPVIAAVNGAAITGGLELALACDFILASEAATFADTHVAMGVFPGWGLSQRLSRRIGIARAKQMSLGGRTIGARLACDWGLANQVHAPEVLMAEALALALEMARSDPMMLCDYRALIDAGAGLPLSEAMELERVNAVRRNASLDPATVGSRRSQKLT